jgi:hypothetical protein
MSAVKLTDQPSDLSAVKLTDQPSDLSAVKLTDQPSDHEDHEDENVVEPSAPHLEMIAYGNGGVKHHEHAIQISNKRTIQPSNQPAEVLCDDVNEYSPLTITTGINSPGVSLYTCLSGPSTEKNSIYDNWPLEECYTVREADIPQETRELLIVRRLNILKDSPRSDETNKRMKKYTAELKERK